MVDIFELIKTPSMKDIESKDAQFQKQQKQLVKKRFTEEEQARKLRVEARQEELNRLNEFKKQKQAGYYKKWYSGKKEKLLKLKETDPILYEQKLEESRSKSKVIRKRFINKQKLRMQSDPEYAKEVKRKQNEYANMELLKKENPKLYAEKKNKRKQYERDRSLKRSKKIAELKESDPTSYRLYRDNINLKRRKLRQKKVEWLKENDPEGLERFLQKEREPKVRWYSRMQLLKFTNPEVYEEYLSERRLYIKEKQENDPDFIKKQRLYGRRAYKKKKLIKDIKKELELD